MDPWNTKSWFRPSAWKALTGGWWLTCSDMSLKPRSSLGHRGDGEYQEGNVRWWTSSLLKASIRENNQCWGLWFTWAFHTFLQAGGWRVCLSAPTGRPQRTLRTRPHSEQQITHNHMPSVMMGYNDGDMWYLRQFKSSDPDRYTKQQHVLPSFSQQSLRRRWPGGWGTCAPCTLWGAAGSWAAHWKSLAL